MKVSEAKTKVCPFISNILPAEDDGFQYGWKVNCTCGDCMAWEYTKEYEVQAFRDDEHDIDLSNGLKPKFGKELPEDEKEGYCKRLGQ